METWEEAIEQFNQYVNNINSSVSIMGVEYFASDILKEMDPIAYRTLLFDYIDAEGADFDDFEDYCPL